MSKNAQQPTSETRDWEMNITSKSARNGGAAGRSTISTIIWKSYQKKLKYLLYWVNKLTKLALVMNNLVLANEQSGASNEKTGARTIITLLKLAMINY